MSYPPCQVQRCQIYGSLLRPKVLRWEIKYTKHWTAGRPGRKFRMLPGPTIFLIYFLSIPKSDLHKDFLKWLQQSMEEIPGRLNRCPRPRVIQYSLQIHQ